MVFHLRPPRLASRRAMAELSRSAGSSRKSWGSQLSGRFSELLADPSDVFLARGRSGKHDEAALREIAMQKLSGSEASDRSLESGGWLRYTGNRPREMKREEENEERERE